MLCLFLVGCAAAPNQRATARSGARTRGSGPLLDQHYTQGSRVGGDAHVPD
jgi:hypothetical protein